MVLERDMVSLRVVSSLPLAPCSKCQRLPESRSLSKHIYLGQREGSSNEETRRDEEIIPLWAFFSSEFDKEVSEF